jgi:hypothetical protein
VWFGTGTRTDLHTSRHSRSDYCKQSTGSVAVYFGEHAGRILRNFLRCRYGASQRVKSQLSRVFSPHSLMNFSRSTWARSPRVELSAILTRRRSRQHWCRFPKQQASHSWSVGSFCSEASFVVECKFFLDASPDNCLYWAPSRRSPSSLHAARSIALPHLSRRRHDV